MKEKGGAFFFFFFFPSSKFCSLSLRTQLFSFFLPLASSYSLAPPPTTLSTSSFRRKMGPPTSEAAAAATSQALSWSDEGKAIVVRIPLPPSSSARGAGKDDDKDDVVVDAGGGGLVVSLASSKTELLRVLQLYGTVDASKVSKSVSRAAGSGKGGSEGGEVVVTLPKLLDESSDERWPSLEASSANDGGGGDASSSSGAAAALAEREHVAKLLTAAKEGDFDGLKAAAEKYRGDAAAAAAGGDGDGGDDAAKQSSGGGVGAIKDGNGRSVLHFAVAGKNTSCAEWLVDECGVDVNVMDDSSASSLFVFRSSFFFSFPDRPTGESSAATASLATPPLPSSFFPSHQPSLLLFPPPPETHTHTFTDETPLAIAAALGDPETVRMLLAKGADATLAGPGTGASSTTSTVNTATTTNSAVGIPPLCRAAASGNAECVRLLLAAGADAASSGPTAEATVGPPLFWAAGSGDGGGEIIKLLLEAGADAKKAGPDGVTALLIATASENADAVEELLKAGADPNAVAEREGVRPLHVAAESGDARVVRALLAAGSDPDAEDAGGLRAIEGAAAAAEREVVEILFPVTTRKIVDFGGGGGGEGEGGGKGKGKGGKGGSGEKNREWSVEGLMLRGAAEQARRQEEHAKSHHHHHGHGDGCGCGHEHGGAAEEEVEEKIEVPAPEEPDAAKAAAAARAGDEAFVAGNVALAFEKYSESLRHATDDSKVWSNRAAAALRGGGDGGRGTAAAERARADARVARALDPTSVKAWFREGSASEALGDYESAARAFFEGYRVNPAQGKECAEAFQAAVAAGRAAHAAKHAAAAAAKK